MDRSWPSKYCSRLTERPIYVSGADPGNSDADIGLRVIANDSSVGNEREKSLLICTNVFFQPGGGVVIAHGNVRWPLSK